MYMGAYVTKHDKETEKSVNNVVRVLNRHNENIKEAASRRQKEMVTWLFYYLSQDEEFITCFSRPLSLMKVLPVERIIAKRNYQKGKLYNLE